MAESYSKLAKANFFGKSERAYCGRPERKGISELLSVVIIIGIIVTVAALVGPWAMNLGRRSVQNTGSGVDSQITCQSTAYDFDSSYGNNGVEWDLQAKEMRAKIINTGTVSLYGFSFQVYIQGTGYRFFKAKQEMTQDNPLKPEHSALIEADINESLAGTVTEVGVMNSVCKSFILKAEF